MKIIIAGSGGQGILYFGKILANSGMLAGKNVSTFPSYGAEMRGGAANCTVIISDNMIGSPIVQTPDILITMNDISFSKFQPVLKKRGLLFYDSSLIRNPVIRSDVKPVPVPAAKIAASVGNVKSANMVMLGGLIAKTALLHIEYILEVFRQAIVAAGQDMNTKSLMEGMAYIEHTKG